MYGQLQPEDDRNITDDFRAVGIRRSHSEVNTSENDRLHENNEQQSDIQSHMSTTKQNSKESFPQSPLKSLENQETATQMLAEFSKDNSGNSSFGFDPHNQNENANRMDDTALSPKQPLKRSASLIDNSNRQSQQHTKRSKSENYVYQSLDSTTMRNRDDSLHTSYQWPANLSNVQFDLKQDKTCQQGQYGNRLMNYRPPSQLLAHQNPFFFSNSSVQSQASTGINQTFPGSGYVPYSPFMENSFVGQERFGKQIFDFQTKAINKEGLSNHTFNESSNHNLMSNDKLFSR